MARSKKQMSPVSGDPARVTGPMRPAKGKSNAGVSAAPGVSFKETTYWDELGTDAHYDRSILPDRWMGLAGIPLADFECRHGFLPGDRGVTCLCWVAK